MSPQTELSAIRALELLAARLRLLRILRSRYVAETKPGAIAPSWARPTIRHPDGSGDYADSLGYGLGPRNGENGIVSVKKNGPAAGTDDSA